MVISEVVTLLVYVVSMAFLPEYFGESFGIVLDVPLSVNTRMRILTRFHMCNILSDLSFVLSTRFIWKTLLIVAISSFPLYMITEVKHRLAPASYAKLRA